jgi:hypothetical protein
MQYLLSQQGDVTAPHMLTAPEPVPQPTPVPDPVPVPVPAAADPNVVAAYRALGTYMQGFPSA